LTLSIKEWGDSDMEKKRKKVTGEKAEQKSAQPKPAPKAQPVLNEKDRMILQDVEHIIWNPDLLKNLKDKKSQEPNGYSKKKAPA